MTRTRNLRLPCLLMVCLALTAVQSWVHAAGRDEVVLYHTDILGTAVAAFDENHELCWSESYTPYGDKTEGSDAIPRVGCGLVGEERGYTGHTEDYSTDLVYMQQRYYDPSIGRFLSVDPISPDPTDTRTLNRYSYAANNPYKFVDPNGEAFIIAAALAIYGAVEIGLAAYDAYDTFKTVTDESASAAEKAVSVGLLAVGMVAPGGGYSKIDDVTKSGVKELTDAAGGTVKSAKKRDIRAPGGRERAKELFREHDIAGKGNRRIVRERDGSRAVVGELEDGTSMRIRFKKNETTRIQAGKQKIQFND